MTTSPRDPAERAVAVVGVGAVLPDAPDAPTFWRNVTEGRDSITEVPADRWSADDYYDADPAAPGKTYSKIGGWVRGVAFDPVKFRIPPKVADAMDGGQKWAVLAAAEALRDAGHPDRPLDLESTGVVLGSAMGGERHYLTTLALSCPEYEHAIEATPAFQALPAATRAALVRELRAEIARRIPETTEDSMPGELANIVAGRVAAVLNLRGPNYTTDAACASSLAAVEAAIHGLVDHHYDVVLTGGMDRNMGASTFIKFCKIGALSPDGSRPYAKGANGFVMGEGGAVLVLKRLDDAERAGDRVYAVIRAVGASSDGKGKGITAPNPVGQILAVRRAWQRAGLPASSMTLLEGHGTSTRVGDVAEVSSCGTVISEAGRPAHPIALGSVKSQIGHLKAGAGAAGLLKAILAVHHRVLPPSIHFDEPNPDIDYAKGSFFVNGTAQPWERPAGGTRRAGVSAFGFGGTNFHVVIEEHVPGMLTRRPRQVQVPGAVAEGGGGGGAVVAGKAPLGEVLALGAVDARELGAALARAIDEAKRGQTPALRAPDAEALRASERLVIAFEGAGDLVQKGEQARKALETDAARSWRVLQSRGVHRGHGAPGKVAFLFPGQGSQYVGMLGALRSEPVVAETFAEADEVMTPILGRPLTSYLWVDAKDAEAVARAELALRDTTICQPAVLSCNVALFRLLGQYGIRPDIVLGHSLGEWAAVVAAGMLPFREALVGVSARAQGMAQVSLGDPGKMASVLGPYEEVAKRLAAIDGYVVAANLNSSKQTVIAGASEAVERAVAAFSAAGLTAQLVPVSHAFHSRIVAPATEVLRAAIGKMSLAAPSIPIVSNVDGKLYPAHDMAEIHDRLARQLASPVQWRTCLETAYGEGARVFVEVGPKRVLQGFAEDAFADRPALCLSTNHPKRGDVASFHEALAGLWAAGLGAPHAAPSAGHGALVVSTTPPAAREVHMPSHDAPTPVAPPAATAGAPNFEALGRMFAGLLQQGMALMQGAGAAPAAVTAAPPALPGSIVLSGAGLGLPGETHPVFDDENVDRVLRGDSFLRPVPEALRAEMVDRRIVRLVKREVGEPSLDPITDTSGVIRLAARKGPFDLSRDFGIAADRAETYDTTTCLAIGAGLEALRDAGIPLVRNYRRTTTGSLLPDKWRLPPALGDETGVVFASAFPGVDRMIDHFSRYYEDRSLRAVLDELVALRQESGNGVSEKIDARIRAAQAQLEAHRYAFDRRFLFQILSMGHAQFAEIIGARGPNTQVNAACASTTQAIALAEDWIRAGRCRRVIVISSDDVTGDRMFGWVGSGFLATGAATTEEVLEKAALPFDRRRNGMLLGMGACGLVIETQDALEERGMRGVTELIATEVANSAFHGTRLDVSHITEVMERLVATVERRTGLSRRDLAREMVFVSHETYTPARGGSASAEVHALRKVFGPDLDAIVVANVKGLTGHPQGVGLEDGVAVKMLEKGLVPAIPNFREPDPELGSLNLSRGGKYPIRFALRLAAGFGSQICMSFERRITGCEERVASKERYAAWLAEVSGQATPVLEVDHRTLRLRDTGAPAHTPGASRWTHGTLPRARLQDAPAPGPIPAHPPVPMPPPVHVPVPVPDPAPAASSSPVPAPAMPALATDPVASKVLALVSEKTGYAPDMLALDLDLEADLGVDTVKQAEVFAVVRETFGIARQDDLKLRDYPTLAHVIAFVRQFRPDLAAKAPPVNVPVPVPAPDPGSGSLDTVAAQVIALVADKTGYPPDMLALDLDLEADLGVDTVKQAEVFAVVRETFGIPRQDDLKLRDYPTLAHVIAFVRQFRPDLAERTPPVHVPVPDPGSAAPDPVATQVIALVADKTGYPPDMLALDLDLEADLGVDTVKQAEVFAVVRETFGIPRQDDLKLRDYPTLAHVIAFVRQFRPDLAAKAPPVHVPVPVPVPEPAAPAPDRDTLLRLPIPTARPALDLCKPTAVRLAAPGRVLVVADRGGAGERLAARLRASGVDVTLASSDGSPSTLEARARAWAAGGDVLGAYVLPALDPDPPRAEIDLPRWRALQKARVGLLCAVSRALYDALARPGTFLVSATRMGGLFGYEAAGALSPSGGAVSGFTKALSRERPEALVKVVDFEPSAGADAVAAALLAETERDPGAVELGVRDGTRFTIAAVPEAAAPRTLRAPLALGASTSFLVTGGAGAITTAIVADLARACRGHFHLVDARPMPDASVRADIARLATDREGLKRDLFARIKSEGGRATPVEVDKRLFDLERGQAILDALATVERAGGKAHYHQVDVTDAGAVSACVQACRDLSGKVDILLHAAGLERSRSLDQKPQDEWDLVFGVKSDGLFNLLSATDRHPPAAIVCFSSVAGRFGNAGQTDYSAGNDLLCKLASAWGAAHPESLAVVFDWTAWGGIGMATRGSIPEIMRRAGIEMLDPAEAVPLVRLALSRGVSGELVAGRTLGILVEPRDPEGGLAPAALAASSRGGLVLGATRWDVHAGLRVEVKADPREEPFLSDHEIDGVPVLPGVMGLEAFAEVSSLVAPGLRVAGLEDVRFFAPMKYYRREPRSFFVDALPVRGPDGAVRVLATLSSLQTLPGQADPQRKVHFAATVLLEQAARSTEAPVVAPLGLGGGSIDRDAIYRVYFHGPAYRVLSDVAGTAKGGVAGSLAADLPADTRRAGARWSFAPRLVELCFQTAGVWEIGATGQLGLPAAADRIVVWSVPEPGRPLVAEAMPRAEEPGRGPCFDAVVRDAEGHVCVELHGYRTSRLPGLVPDDRLAPFRAVVRP